MNAFVYVWQNPYVRLAVYAVLIALLFLFFKSTASVLVVFICAYLIAYLLNPLLDWLEKRKVSRAIGFGIVVVFILLLSLVAYILSATIVGQFGQLVSALPSIGKTLSGWIKDLSNWGTKVSHSPYLSQYSDQISNMMQDSLSKLSTQASKALEGVLSQSGTVIGGIVNVANWVFQLFLILILSLYIMIDYHRINTTLLNVFPEPWHPKVLELSGQVSQAVGSYIRGQILIASIVGLMIGVGLTIVGVPSGLALGFLAGAFNIVPYLGVIIALVPTILLALSVSWVKVVLACLVFFIANQVEGNFLSPQILGRTTNLHPATVLISILVGVALMGIVGALIAVPIAALLKLLMQNYYYPSRFYQTGEVVTEESQREASKISS